MKYILSSHEIKKLKMVTKETDIDVVLFVSVEQYPASVSFVTDLNISLQPN